MFITSNDFDVNPYNIPNIPDNGFSEYVSEAEETCLTELLGKTLYDEFIAGLTALPAVYSNSTEYSVDEQVVFGISVWKSLQNVNTGNDPVEGVWWTKVEDNKWLKLRDGYPYTDSFQKVRNYSGVAKFLKPRIFALWTRDTFDSNSGAGVVVANLENSTQVAIGERISRAWNVFADLAGAVYGTETDFWGDPLFNPDDEQSWGNEKNSLYGFLVANKDANYPDWEWENPGFMSMLNI